MLQSSSLVHILSHEYLAVRPLSQEVLWSLSFPGGSFGFVIYCPVTQETRKTNGHFLELTLTQERNRSTRGPTEINLSFTKLGHPSFFQLFQFSSVLRMCCQR